MSESTSALHCLWYHPYEGENSVKVVKVDDVKAGARVARDVVDLRGTLLFKAGTALTDQLISQIRARKVSHLFIESDDPSPTEEKLETPQDASAVDEKIDAVFSDVSEHPVMAELREAAKRYLKNQKE